MQGRENEMHELKLCRLLKVDRASKVLLKTLHMNEYFLERKSVIASFDSRAVQWSQVSTSRRISEQTAWSK
jgi:hypothetical protein